MDWINGFLNRVTMYWLVLWFLRVLIAASVILSYFELLPYVWWHILATLLILMGACYAVNFVFAKLFRVAANYESQFITAEILTLIVGPGNPLENWQFLLLVAAIAMASKYLVAVNKRHLFNPAAIGLVLTALTIGQSASWWIGNQYLFPIVLLGGLILTHKIRWFHLLLAFVGTYSALLTGMHIYDGASLQQAMEILRITFLNSGILFFATIMLTEPLTAPATKRNRILYGVLVALILVVVQRFYVNIYYSLELSLVIGNLIAFVLSPNPKIVLHLKEKSYFARNSLLVSFESEKPIRFKAGQFMQFTLPHKKADSRGSRRYFSIASSPTENQIMIATKLAEESSSFKKELKDLAVGHAILASSLDGDFILPKNQNQELVFIAGGVGIAPFRSIIKNLIDNNARQKITLFYSNKDFDEIGFTDLLDEAEEKIGLKTVYVLNGKIPQNWSGKKGFITAEMIQKEVPNYANCLYYLSGPQAMVSAYTKLLKDIGISSRKIAKDYFPGYE